MRVRKCVRNVGTESTVKYISTSFEPCSTRSSLTRTEDNAQRAYKKPIPLLFSTNLILYYIRACLNYQLSTSASAASASCQLCRLVLTVHHLTVSTVNRSFFIFSLTRLALAYRPTKSSPSCLGQSSTPPWLTFFYFFFYYDALVMKVNIPEYLTTWKFFYIWAYTAVFYT